MVHNRIISFPFEKFINGFFFDHLYLKKLKAVPLYLRFERKNNQEEIKNVPSYLNLTS